MLQMYMATVMAGLCTMSVNENLDTGIVAPRNKHFSTAAVDGPDFACITPQLTEDEQLFEYDVHALGHTAPSSPRRWPSTYARGTGNTAAASARAPAVYPASTPHYRIPELPSGRVIDKDYCRVALPWTRPER